jgi:hypothetical protein
MCLADFAQLALLRDRINPQSASAPSYSSLLSKLRRGEELQTSAHGAVSLGVSNRQLFDAWSRCFSGIPPKSAYAEWR